MLNDLKNFLRVQNKCPFLIDFYGGYLEESQVKIFLEFMNNGNLKDFIAKHQRENKMIEEKIIKNITERVLHGLSYMHQINH